MVAKEMSVFTVTSVSLVLLLPYVTLSGAQTAGGCRLRSSSGARDSADWTRSDWQHFLKHFGIKTPATQAGTAGQQTGTTGQKTTPPRVVVQAGRREPIMSHPRTPSILKRTSSNKRSFPTMPQQDATQYQGQGAFWGPSSGQAPAYGNSQSISYPMVNTNMGPMTAGAAQATASQKLNARPQPRGSMNYLTAALQMARMAALQRALNPDPVDELKEYPEDEASRLYGPVPGYPVDPEMYSMENVNVNTGYENTQAAQLPTYLQAPATQQQGPSAHAAAPRGMINDGAKKKSPRSNGLSQKKVDVAVGELLRQVHKHQAVSYSRSDCEVCQQAESFLEKHYRLPMTVFQLDRLNRGKEVLEFLGEITGVTNVPQIFVCGYYIGGYDELMKFHQTGELKKFAQRCAQ